MSIRHIVLQFGAFGIAFDIADIVRASIELSKDGKTEGSTGLRQFAEVMIEERAAMLQYTLDNIL